MKNLLLIALLLTSANLFAGDDCANIEYKDDPNKVATFTFPDLNKIAQAHRFLFELQVMIQPLNSINGMSFYGGAIKYGDNVDLYIPLVFNRENGNQTSWFLTSLASINKTTVVLWYKNAACDIGINIPLKHNKSFEFARSLPLTSRDAR